MGGGAQVLPGRRERRSQPLQEGERRLVALPLEDVKPAEFLAEEDLRHPGKLCWFQKHNWHVYVKSKEKSFPSSRWRDIDLTEEALQLIELQQEDALEEKMDNSPKSAIAAEALVAAENEEADAIEKDIINLSL